MLAHLAGEELEARYDGYSSCPIVTAEGKMLLAEFDYTMTQHKTIPFIDTVKERRDMWYL
ncbi:MAG: pyridine nucleotide-disulfide oxidoreductase, partial [Actinobacteria bacterium]|nr:pyridine nucleotide-disulfide oxidoreductase [Actinomycetota bacterium]NIV58189.1 pyridine nucleotide-disulfide oxidoreductase [Actinomycetota bacterium]NIX53000.1 pyridine nucleotide-disulfide oxidoreductase [Actinomycetota bacterium]